MITEGTAVWEEGEPANLQAAASDALWWLVWLQNQRTPDERLDRCVLRLTEQLEAAGVPTGVSTWGEVADSSK